jgi:hypothetical protein
MVSGGPVGPPIYGNCFTFTYIGKYSKNLLLKNQFAREAEIYLKTFRHSIKIVAPGGRKGPQ